MSESNTIILKIGGVGIGFEDERNMQDIGKVLVGFRVD
jgi:hypothetical protein